MLLKVEGEMSPHLASSDESKLHLPQHRADGKECSSHNFCTDETAIPDRNSMWEEWFVWAPGFRGLHSSWWGRQLSLKQWESVSKLVHTSLDRKQSATGAGGQVNLQRPSSNDLFPPAAMWLPKVPQPPQIAPLSGNKHYKEVCFRFKL